jgi:hypothetical protein
MTRHAPEATLPAARALALYALSLDAAGSAVIAFSPRTGLAWLQLVALATALAAALILGEWLPPLFTALVEPKARVRFRLWAGATYAGVALYGLAAALATADLDVVRSLTAFFAALQVLVLLLADLLGGPLTAVANALVLTLLAGFGGGVPAAVSTIGFVVALAYFLAFDHFTAQLASHPAASFPPTSVAARDASRVALPLAAAMAAAYVLAPPAPHAGLADLSGDARVVPEEVARAYRLLLTLGLGGGLAVFALARLLRRRPAQPVSEEVLEAERGPEELLAEPAWPGARAERSRRGRVIDAYLRLLSRAAERGFRRRPSQTPDVIAGVLPEPKTPVAALTALFVAARYGPAEPTDADGERAETALGEVLARWRRRR